MTQYKRPDEAVFASGAKPGELEAFPDIARGWGVAFEQTAGIPPMEWFNALFKRNDEALRYLLQRGIPEWSTSEDYPAGAYVQEGGKTWRAKVASQGKQPTLEGTVWEESALTSKQVLSMVSWANLSGKPTTLTGYGITDALAKYESATAANKLSVARAIVLKGDVSGKAYFDGSSDVSIQAQVPGVPGQVSLFAMSSPPVGWLKCNGAAVSRSVYSGLFSMIGTSYGVGDGASTFNLPDLRGEFVRGWDDARGVDPGRAFASKQMDTFKAHYHTTVGNNQYGNFQYIADVGVGGTIGGAAGSSWSPNAPFNNGGGGSETRPRNIALLYCIKI
ncbi:tail fiber protein [Pseudomonas aeruginosa]|uniref:tail fiber protein n=1 Tax=Pseudomonas aeruginosa TaxID=287 RepID=UPI000EAC1C8F|nr:tail fiber protein [Pseudomonas aeruginosa]EJB8382831.1 tail fiber protein [Pseudomonas aeruginosa]MCT2413288.1 tail fiber protein [Pseudomonas aeruginosa]MCT4938501.1 tail fiber protein [Pseudomonas aeruginosa]GLF57769.1 hypothetical protein VNPA141826_19270 [Pseudomonas aeruginosa]GLF76554.1 hypothetical protein VNPA152081_16250 [Pseudomonas aeruginosa]